MSLSIAGRDYIAATGEYKVAASVCIEGTDLLFGPPVGLTELLVRARVEWLAQETGVAPDVVFKYIRWKRRRIRARMFEADQERELLGFFAADSTNTICFFQYSLISAKPDSRS